MRDGEDRVRGGRVIGERECAAVKKRVEIEIDGAGQGQGDEHGQHAAEEQAEEHGEGRIEKARNDKKETKDSRRVGRVGHEINPSSSSGETTKQRKENEETRDRMRAVGGRVSRADW